MGLGFNFYVVFQNITTIYPYLALHCLALVSPVVVAHGVALPVEERAQGP